MTPSETLIYAAGRLDTMAERAADERVRDLVEVREICRRVVRGMDALIAMAEADGALVPLALTVELERHDDKGEP
jgi:hypothetical protein